VVLYTSSPGSRPLDGEQPEGYTNEPNILATNVEIPTTCLGQAVPVTMVTDDNEESTLNIKESVVRGNDDNSVSDVIEPVLQKLR